MEVHSQMMPLIGSHRLIEIRLTPNVLLWPRIMWKAGLPALKELPHLLKTPEKHVCFSVILAMSASISFQITDLIICLKVLEKVNWLETLDKNTRLCTSIINLNMHIALCKTNIFSPVAWQLQDGWLISKNKLTFLLLFVIHITNSSTVRHWSESPRIIAFEFLPHQYS